ncbi:MAG: TonB family protein [Candidatus Omnitrophica bacterium]|nr:TonB family protein [Candidatus Omnitrophota bacterium]
MKRYFFGGIAQFLFVCLFLPFFCSALHAEPIDAQYQKELNILVGETENVIVQGLTRVSVVEPKIADVVSTDEKKVEVMGKEAGTTALFVWDQNGKSVITITVNPIEGNKEVKSRLQKLLDSADIKGVTLLDNPKEQKVVITGDVNKDQQPLFDQIIKPFDEQKQIINLITTEKIEKQILINMQISEVNTTALKNLGLEWGNIGGELGSGIALAYEETKPNLTGSLGDKFKTGDFIRTTGMQATLYALEQQGNAQTISRPKIVVKNNEKAHFNVGGEIPLSVTTLSSNGLSQESTTYKEYGVILDITPAIKGDKIDIDLNVDITDIDSSGQFTGKGTPFTKRSAQTKLFLENNQSIVLAGLISKRRSQSINKVPFFSNIPIVGGLFRHKYNPDQQKDTEMVITLTPTIMEQKVDEAKKEDVVAPKQIYVFQPATTMKRSTFDMSKVKDIPANMDEYIRGVLEKVSKNMDYPVGAELYNWEGTVKVETLIMKDGSLAMAVVNESSGFELFDQHAVSVVTKSAPFPKFPAAVDQSDVRLLIPITYKLNK